MEEVTTGEVVGTTLTWVVTYGPCGERVKGRPTKLERITVPAMEM